jgi:hypothetical protein
MNPVLRSPALAVAPASPLASRAVGNRDRSHRFFPLPPAPEAGRDLAPPLLGAQDVVLDGGGAGVFVVVFILVARLFVLVAAIASVGFSSSSSAAAAVVASVPPRRIPSLGIAQRGCRCSSPRPGPCCLPSVRRRRCFSLRRLLTLAPRSPRVFSLAVAPR